MNILDINDNIKYDSLEELSKFLVLKNGKTFQALITAEEASETIVELLNNQIHKRNSANDETESEIADMFVTLEHIEISYNIKSPVKKLITETKDIQFNELILSRDLAQFNKEILKNLNRDANNADELIKYSALVKTGLLQYIQKYNNFERINKHIIEKIERTKKRNNFTYDYEQEMKKNDWDNIFTLIAYSMASASHCVSKQVASLIVKDRRIISTGINGTPSGCINCDDIFPKNTDPKFNREEHHKFSNDSEIHAEKNALTFLANNGSGHSLKGAVIYNTLEPCNGCMKEILNTDILRLVFAEKYDKTNYPEIIKDRIKSKGFSLEHKPISNTIRPFVFIQNNMVKATR